MNSHTCAARARMPFTFQVAIFIRNESGPLRAPNNYVLGTELRPADDLELVVHAFDALDLAGDLAGLGFLAVARDGAPQADTSFGGRDVDRAGRQLVLRHLERALHQRGELLVRIGLRRLGLWLRL